MTNFEEMLKNLCDNLETQKQAFKRKCLQMGIERACARARYFPSPIGGIRKINTNIA